MELIHDLKINSVSDELIDVDEIRLKAERANGIKCTIGIIYRHSKSNLTKFKDRLYSVLEKINLIN